MPPRRRLAVQVLESRLVPASALTQALDLPDDAVVEIPATNDPRSVASLLNVAANGLAGMPTGPNHNFVLLSNGDANRAYGPRQGYPEFGVDFAPGGSAGDDQRLKVTVPVPVGATHVKFDFNLFTQEIPSFSVFTNDFNDTFKITATPIGAGAPSTLLDTTINDLEAAGMPLQSNPANAPIYLFDTGLFAVDYRVPPGATAITFDYLVTDVGPGAKGHGGGDSAIAIDNFRFASAKQKIWLNFDGAALVDYPVNGGTTTFPMFQPADIRSVDTRAALIASILAGVQAKFADFDIDFVTIQPVAGTYGTITIGGNTSNPVVLGASADPRMVRDLGMNTDILSAIGDVFGGSVYDYGNASDTTPGFVLSDQFELSPLYTLEDAATLQKRLEVTISHEVAHTLGTPHVASFFPMNIMAEFAPRDPNATFEDAERPLAESGPDHRGEINIHDYLESVLGSSGGLSSLGFAAALAQYQSLLNIPLKVPLYDVVFGLLNGAADGTPGANDHAATWMTIPQLDVGMNQVAIPNLGSNTRITFYASSAPGTAPVVYSGSPAAGEVGFKDGFEPLYDFSGNPLTSIPAAYGVPGALNPIPGGLPISFSPFVTPGLKIIDPKKGFTFNDDFGNLITVKSSSKNGTVGIQLDDPDGNGVGPIARIELQGTTAKDKLEIKMVKPSGFHPFVEVGAIVGTQLGTLSAKSANLTGAGITFGGSVKSITLHDVFGGADIRVGGCFKTKTALTVRDVAAGTDIECDGQLTLKAARIGAGTIHAALLAKMDVKGDAKALAPIPGDFMSDVTIDPGRTLTAKEAKLKLLDKVTIAGRTFGADFIVQGNVGKFKTGTFENSTLLVGYAPTDPLNPFAGGSFTSDFAIGGFTTTGVMGFAGKTFANSDIVAAQVGPVKLASVETNNGGIAFGVAAKNGLANNLASIASPELTYDPKAALPQFAQDFFIKVI
ncbi:MAG TPA: hypothetical protein VHR66_21440 [Gemmataceae bacterium]|jgi:hypothetical protein|nr:hypothetical protein [Gemmataceae bacterium]